MHTDRTDTTRRARRRIGAAARVTALLVVPVLLLGGCKIKDVTDPIVKPIEDIIIDPIADLLDDVGDNEIATPQFEIVNGITIQVVVRLDDLAAGQLPITVHLRCAGGTHASGTVTLTDSGSISVGETTFTPGWPAGTDCLVSQEIVQGVETVEATLTWLDSNDVRATFENAA